MSGTRGGLRPRYGRIVALAAASSTTLVSLVGGVVTDPADEPAAGRPPAVSLAGAATSRTPGGPASTSPNDDAAASAALLTASSTGLRASLSVGTASSEDTTSENPTGEDPAEETSTDPEPDQVPSPPARSGHGRRVVFSESQQRVWLIGDDATVQRTYLVSGSLYDNLDPGSYEVYSRSLNATGVDGSDLRYMVRFTQGWNDAIGFHWIPRMNGERMQTRAELGTPQSHGCVRQAAPDARALWRFAPVGTSVVVTA